MRILVVDDDTSQRTGIAEWLNSRGHEVTESCNGSEAAEYFQLAAAEGRPFDLVLSDTRMPHLNGDELHRQIKLELGSCRFVLMSGSFSDAVRTYASQEGIEMLSKPVVDEVLEAILTA